MSLKQYFTSSTGRFKLVAFIEGVSFILLLFVAMPLKYIWGQPFLVRQVGMIHGLLFILYIFLAIQLAVVYRWKMKKILIALAGSLIPFGTFFMLKDLKERE